MIVFDTDILSTFAKVHKLKLLFKLFKGQKLAYSHSVKADLQKAKQKGYDFVDALFDEPFTIVEFSKEEMHYLKEIEKEKSNLGRGELEALALCKTRGWALATNDIRAQKAAESLGIDFLSLSDILHGFLKEKILSKSEVEKLIAEIEDKDKVRIMDKDEILKD